MPTTMTSDPTLCLPPIPMLTAPAAPILKLIVQPKSQPVTVARVTSLLREGDSENSAKPCNTTLAKTWKRPRCPGSLPALAMMTLCPVHTTPLPRLHVAPRAPNGTLMVYDRAWGEQFLVYSPRFIHQFQAGHRAGFWYLRPATGVESGPQSQGYATAHTAIEALRAGHRGLSTVIRDQSRKLARVTWSTRAGERSRPAQPLAGAEACRTDF